jgi:hypothetical protein
LTTGSSGEVTVAVTGPRVLQIVNASTTTQVAVATTTYTDTTLTATITPSSISSKVLVFVSQQTRAIRSATPQGAGVRLLRDASVIFTPVSDATGPYPMWSNAGGATSISIASQLNFQFLDSPATTGSITYKTQGRPYTTATTGSVFFQESTTTPGTSFITLMEVIT